MTPSDEKIHVIPLGVDHWEVEMQSGAPRAHETGKESAVAAALDLARDEGIETIIVHDGHGVTEAVSAHSGPSNSVENHPPAAEPKNCDLTVQPRPPDPK